MFIFRQREAEHEQNNSATGSNDDVSITRHFRYMRRKPTLISYQPPPGEDETNVELADIVVDSDHMILDRIQHGGSGSAGAGSEGSSTLQRSQEQHVEDHHHRHHHYHGSGAGHHVSEVEVMQQRVDDSSLTTQAAKLTKPLVVYIDGPFGAPTSQIFRAQHAVLIGTGIGVTPFASILQSIMHRYWQARNTCPKCQYSWTNNLSASVGLNLRKVTFKNSVWYL